MKRTSRLPWLVAAASLLMFLLGACSSTQTVGGQVDDTLITSKVKAKLAADPEVNPFKVDVDTINGVVYLRGVVSDKAVSSEALKLARDTDGVKFVVNDLVVGEYTAQDQLADARIASKVKIKLAADPEINPFDIDVDSRLGVVTLNGQVKTAGQKREAEAIARGTDGVRSVRNQIRVESGIAGL
jgi:hyperosmotically inducible periplasmic protein